MENAKTCQEKKIRGRMGMDWTKSAKKDGQNKVKSSDMDSLTFGFLLNANLKVDFLNFQKFSLNFWVVVLSMNFSHEKV